jgi:hypothetical protein
MGEIAILQAADTNVIAGILAQEIAGKDAMFMEKFKCLGFYK